MSTKLYLYMYYSTYQALYSFYFLNCCTKKCKSFSKDSEDSKYTIMMSVEAIAYWKKKKFLRNFLDAQKSIACLALDKILLSACIKVWSKLAILMFLT